jgi:hypothetical protein
MIKAKSKEKTNVGLLIAKLAKFIDITSVIYKLFCRLRNHLRFLDAHTARLYICFCRIVLTAFALFSLYLSGIRF